MLVRDIFPPKKIKKIIKEEVCGIKPYKTKKRKYFNIGSRIFIAIGIIFIIVFSFTGFSFEAMGEEKLRVELYSSKCAGDTGNSEEITEAGWQNIKNAGGEPDVLPKGSIDSFFEGNSAVYSGGASSIICQGFRETDAKENFFQSAKIYFSFAIDEIEADKTLISTPNNAESASISVLNQRRSASIKQQEQGSQKQIETSIIEESNIETLNIDTKIIIWRSLDGGETWHSLDKISILPLSNALNNGYFNFSAPFLKSWEDVKNLKIKFEGVIGGETNIIAYLDSVWVEAEYIKQHETEHEMDTKEIEVEPLEIDDEKIEFVHSDDNSNENLIIKSNKKIYSGIGSAEVYFSVTNTGEESEIVDLQVYFPKDEGNVISLSKIALDNETNDVIARSPEGTTKQSRTSTPNNTSAINNGIASLAHTGSLAMTDHWEDLELSENSIPDDRNFLEKVLKLGVERKPVPENLKVKKSTDLENEKFVIEQGKTQYFKMEIEFPWKSSGEFYIEAIGDKKGYGLLDPWYNSNWDRRRSTTINNPGSSALSNYQVKITLTAADFGNPYTNINANGYDLRFTKSDETTEIPYWIESWDNTATSTIWVKVTGADSLPVGNTTIYMYYDNADLIQFEGEYANHGTNTFEFFDDFSGDLSKWATSGTPENVDGVCVLNSSPNAKIYQDGMNAQTKVYRGRYKASQVNNRADVMYFRDSGNNPMLIVSFYSDGHIKYYDGAFKNLPIDTTYSAGTYYTVEVKISASTDKASIWIDNVLKADDVNTVARTEIDELVIAQNSGVLNIDWFFERKYASLEPTHGAWGSEEQETFVISGTVYLHNETTQATSGNGGPCDGSTANLSVRINGGTLSTTTCSNTDASFTFSGLTVSAGDTITIYQTSSQKANRVYVSDATSDSGMNLYIDTVAIGDEQDGTVTILDLLDYDDDENAADMLFDAEDAAPDTLTVNSGKELHIHTGDTFAPGGTVTLTAGDGSDLHIDDNAGFTAGGAISIGGSWTADTGATFTHNDNNVTFTCTATGQTITTNSQNFYNLIFNGSGGSWSFSSAASVSNNFTITNGTVTAPATTLTVSQNFTNNGTFTHNNGTVTFNDNTKTSQLVYSAATTFYGLTCSTGGKALQFDETDQTNITNTLTMQGSDCATGRIFLDSTTNDNKWDINYTGGTVDIDYVDVEDSNAVAALTADNSTAENNNNTGWTVNAGVCSITISGTSDLASGTVAVAVNDTLQSSKTGIISGGTWSISNVAVGSSGSIVTVWVHEATDANESTAVTKYDGSGDMAGMILNQHTLSIGSVDDQSLTVTNLGQYDNDQNEDIMHSANSSTLNVDDDGLYADEKIDILSGDTLTIGGVETLTTHDAAINGSLTSGGAGTFNVSGSWDNNNDFNSSTETINFTSTTTETIDSSVASDSDFYNLTFNGSGGAWTLTTALTAQGDITTTAGTISGTQNLIVNGGVITGTNGSISLTGGTTTFSGTGNLGPTGTGTYTFSDLTLSGTTTATGNFTVSSVLTISSTFSLDASDKTITLSGSGTPFVVSGTFTPSTSTLKYTYNGATGTNITATTYNNLEFSPAGAGANAYTLGTAASQTINTNGNLTIGDGTNAVTVTAATNNPTLNIDGNFSISANAIFTASASGTFTLASNWTNAGTFTHSSGTVTFDATTTGKTITDGGSDWNNVTFNGSDGGWSFADATTIGGDLTITAGTLSGMNDIAVNGGDADGNGTINLTGGTFTLDGAGNFGGNTAWIFYNLTFGDGAGATASTATGTGGITVSNVLTIAANQTLNAGSKTWTLSGSGTPFVISGIFTSSTSTFEYTNATSANVTATTYNNLQFNPASGTPTYTLGTAGSQTITTNSDFIIVDGTVTAATNNPIINIGGNLTIDSDSDGDNGSFTKGTGTLTFNGEWSYRKMITLTGQTGAGTNYQVKLLVGESSGSSGYNFHLEGNCSNFPTDIRFTDDDKTTELDFWVEETTGTTPNQLATVWVEVADDLSSGTVDIYIYYGNSGAISASNGTNTFEFFDDFFNDSDNPEDPDSWEKLADMPSAVNQHSFEECNGVLYVACTIAANDYRLYAYDIVNNTWEEKGAMPKTGTSHAWRCVGSKLYSIGGQLADSSNTDENYEYDPATNNWTQKTDMPTIREDMASGVVDGKIYVFGGVAPGVTLHSEVEVYDPVTNLWDTVEPMPVPRALGDFGCAYNGKIYLFSGSSNTSGYPSPLGSSNRVDVYDPSNDSWTQLANIPTVRCYKEAEEVNGFIYVMSGDTVNQGDETTKNEAYDVANNTWVTKTSTPYGARGIAMTKYNNKIYFGGGKVDGVKRDDLYRYDPAEDDYVFTEHTFSDNWDENLFDDPSHTSYEVSNKKLFISGTAETHWDDIALQAKNTVGIGKAIRAKVQDSAGDSYGGCIGFRKTNEDFRNPTAAVNLLFFSSQTRILTTATSYTNTAAGSLDGDEHIVDLLWYSGNVKAIVDGSEIGEHIANVPTENLYPSVGLRRGEGSGETYFDWILVRKYAATEPSYFSDDPEDTPSGTWLGGAAAWTDNNTTKSDMGNTVINGGIDLGSNVKASNLTINANKTLDATTGNYSMNIGGNWTNSGTFTCRSGTVTFDATTTGKTINPGSSNFYNLTFDGSGGGWSFGANSVAVTNNFTITNGTVTAPSTTLTISGNFSNSGTFTHNSGTVIFDASSGNKTITDGGSAFHNITFDGSGGGWTYQDGSSTAPNQTTVQAGTATYLNAKTGTVSVTGGVLNVDWYLGVHAVNAASTATNINTGACSDITISEINSASTVWRYNSGWGSSTASQTTGTGAVCNGPSDGINAQPTNTGAIRIREYSNAAGTPTYYLYNLEVVWQSSYGQYDYYDDYGGKYLTSTLNTSSGHDEVIGSGWHRSAPGTINGTKEYDGVNNPPTQGSWYAGMLTGLDVTITGTSISFSALDSNNDFTDTASTQTQITVTTSATSGYVVTAWETQKMTHNDFPAVEIDNFNVNSGADYGDYADPLPWTNNCITAAPNNECGFGFTSDDTSVGGSNRYNSGTEYAGFSESSASLIRVADWPDPVNGNIDLITYRISASNIQRPGTYSTTIVYVVTAEY